MQENYPVLVTCKKNIKTDNEKFKKIPITSGEFSIGRNLQSSFPMPIPTISRNHCVFRKTNDDEWIVEDHSSYGIEVNGCRVGKGASRKLSHEDVISLDPTNELLYKFIDPSIKAYGRPKKRIKLDDSNKEDINLDDLKLKFDESQTYEMKINEERLQNAKQMQNTSIMLKKHLELDMSRKMQQLESEYALQIENLKGEKNEVEKHKAMLIEEKDAQLATVKVDMQGKITELMEQIQKLNETESEFLKENSSLKEKLLKERAEFLAELSRENTSKQDMLDKLEAKIREQEEIRLKEKQDLEDMLRKETEQLRLAKEKELKELEERKQVRELELVEELNNIKKNLEDQMDQTEQQRLKAEQELNEQMEQMKKLSDEDKAKMENLMQEREDIQKKLTEAQMNAQKSVEELQKKVHEREIELAALAAERIQKQAEQSGEVISSLQEQLQRVRSQLQQVESEKKNLESRSVATPFVEGSSKQATLEQVGEVMESELQCSICGELFVCATTLNCSHTFCKYCIVMWKRKKKDCPICRAPITSECRSLVLDSFIEKMVQTLSEEMKTKRQELLQSREAEVAAMITPTPATSTARTGRRTNSRASLRNSTVSRTMTMTIHSIRPTPSFPTVELTRIPTYYRSVPRPQPLRLPLMPPSVRVPRPLVQVPSTLQQGQVFRILQQNEHTVMVVPTTGGDTAGVSMVSQGTTTADTGVATIAVHAATGLPAARSDNSRPRPQ